MSVLYYLLLCMVIPFIIFISTVFSSNHAYIHDEFHHALLGKEKKNTTKENAIGAGTSIAIAGASTYILNTMGNAFPAFRFFLAVVVASMFSSASADANKTKDTDKTLNSGVQNV